MKILIVSTYFPPLNSIASLRPYSWAKYWSRAGHDVTVLTTTKQISIQSLKLPNVGFKVKSYPIPIHSALRSLILLFKRNKSESDTPSSRKGVGSGLTEYATSFALVRNYFEFCTRTGIFSGSRMPDIHDLWALGSCYQLGREKWDWVVSTGWPYSVHFVGYLTKIRKLTKGWLVDWRDPWIIDNPVFPGIPVFRTIEKIFEKRFHSHADRITTVSEPWAESLATVYNRQVNVIYNGFDPDDYKQLDNSRFFPIDDKIRIIHTGSIYSGHRNPAILFSAIKAIELSEGAEAQRIEIDFAGPRGFPSEMIKQYGVEKYCVDKGFLPRELALKMQKEASFLLYLDWSDTGNKGVIGGKTFEYLFAGPPILVVGGNTRSIASKLIIDTNKGIAFGNNVEMLADFLRNALKRNCQNLLFEGTDTIWQYSRENQARQMLGLLEK